MGEHEKIKLCLLVVWQTLAKVFLFLLFPVSPLTSSGALVEIVNLITSKFEDQVL